MGQSIFECVVLTGTWSAEGIMASGHVNRTNRPNTWLHRPSLRREDSPCQPGAVHTWPLTSESDVRSHVGYGGAKQTRFAHHEFCRS
jgi:hypothetical protein